VLAGSGKDSALIPYVLRRLLVLPVIVFLVTIILFALMWQLPIGLRARIYVPTTNRFLLPDEEAALVERAIRLHGLDKPWPVQYASWLRAVATGNWGYSPTWQQPVLEGLLQRVPATAELVLVSMVPCALLGVGLGGVAARHRGRFPDHAIRATTFLGWALPSFILGLMLMNVFYAWLGWLPPERLSIWAGAVIHSDQFRSYTGMHTVDALLNLDLRILWDAIRHLILPAICLAFAEWALLTRIMRSSMLDVLRQDYVTTARSKGAPEGQVFTRHVRRNALLPVISTGGVAVSMLVSGIVVIESVFNINGVGSAAAEAMSGSDVPVAVGFAVFTCVATVVASLVADLLYAVADPRVRLY
jgi:peptide/nickel transport system permease protein